VEGVPESVGNLSQSKFVILAFKDLEEEEEDL
jgi:hypothetical protein